MRQHEVLQDRDYKRIRSAVLKEAVDPRLKSAAERELRSEDFVLREDQKQAADCYPQCSKGNRVSSCCISFLKHYFLAPFTSRPP